MSCTNDPITTKDYFIYRRFGVRGYVRKDALGIPMNVKDLAKDLELFEKTFWGSKNSEENWSSVVDNNEMDAIVDDFNHFSSILTAELSDW